MKNNAQERSAHEQMLPGVITATGFLGEDLRFPADIIADDEKQFSLLGLDFDGVATRMEHLRDEGEKGLGEPVTVDGKWVVQTGDARGKLACPFEDGIFHKNAVTVQRADFRRGKRGALPAKSPADILVFSDLTIHLLKVHHFCQGKGSDFRIEPAVVKKLLF